MSPRGAGRGARYRALLLDFYGTLVEEDTELIARIVQRVAASSPLAPPAADVGARWSRRFSELCAQSHGSRFETQRALERASLEELLASYRSPLDADELSAELFAYWAAPKPIDGAAEFLSGLRVSACVVSNIDADDLAAAIAKLGWALPERVTSEGCRAYKPRREPFESALARLGCAPEDVLHVGDSLGSDVRGAAALGIPVAWVNPRGKSLPADLGARPSHVVARVSELLAVIL